MKKRKEQTYNIACYCRVSTEMQKEKESIENQKSRLLQYCNEQNLPYTMYEDDGYSAKDTKRPALSRLINDIKKHEVKTVLVTKLDRITRSIRDLLDLLELFEDYNVSFKSITQPVDTSSAMGRGFVRLLGEFAQLEREMTSERVGEDMRHRALKGVWNGGVVPHGYLVAEKQLKPQKDEAVVIAKIYDKYIELESLRGVTQWLNSKGYKTRNGATWATSSIRRILSNPTYIGKIWYNKRVSSKMTHKLKSRPEEDWIVAEGKHEPIVSPKTYDTVQVILARQRKEPKRKMSNYLLSGLVRCGRCGATLSGYTQKVRRGGKLKAYSYYKCHNNTSKGASVCTGNTIRRDILEEKVADTILSLAKDKEFKVDAKKALTAFNKKIVGERSPLMRQKTSAEKKNIQIVQKKKNLLERLEDNTIDKALYKRRIDELNAEFEDNKEKIYHSESKLNDIGIDTVDFNSVYEVVKDFKKSWRYLNFQGKKDLLSAIVSKIEVKDEDIKIDLYFLSDLMSNVCSRTGRDSLQLLV